MGKFLGIVDITVDGITAPTGDDATLDPGGKVRTVVKGSKVHGFREEVMESKCEFNVAIDASFSVDFYRNATSATLVFKADTGQTWSIAGAWCETPPPIGQKDGKAKVTFVGPPADEIIGA